jgi:hypothetical protein
MTEEDVFDPSKNTLIERIAKFKVVANQIRIARAHNMPSFPNRKCLHLSAKEESMVFEAARNYWKYVCHTHTHTHTHSLSLSYVQSTTDVSTCKFQSRQGWYRK